MSRRNSSLHLLIRRYTPCDGAGERGAGECGMNVGKRVGERVGERIGERVRESVGESVGERVGERVGKLVAIVGGPVLFGSSVGTCELYCGAWVGGDAADSLHTHITSLVHGPVLVPAVFSFRAPGSPSRFSK